jgi:ABC-2 type transport system permease protein
VSPVEPGAVEPGVGVVLGRTVRAEWARLWTVRSTWLFVLVAVVAVAGISVLVGADSRGAGQTEDGETVWIAAQTLGMLALLLLLPMASVSTTADYGTGGIVPTLQWTPRRGILLAARTAVVVATVTAFGLLLVLTGAVLITRIAPVLALPRDEGGDTLLVFAYVHGLGAVLAVGVGLLLRSTAGSVVAALGLMLVLPLLLGSFPFEWAQDLSALLPGSSALKLVFDEGPPGLSIVDARVTLGTWAAAALVAGGWRLLRTDANR